MDSNQLINQEFSKLQKNNFFFPQEVSTWCPKYVIQALKKYI